MLKIISLFMASSVLGASEIAFCSGIGGNLTALNAVLKDIESRKIENIYILGDICGIGPRNDECISLIRNNKKITCILGRWDRHFSGQAIFETRDPDIQWFLNWSKNKISKENIDWINRLDEIVVTDFWSAISGRFDDNAQWLRVEKVTDARRSFDGLYGRKLKLGFTGLTGVPVAFFDDNPISFSQDGNYKIKKNTGSLINVGSVGAPKDDNPKSRYVIFNGNDVTTISVSYDIELEIREMEERGFPQGLQEKLKMGR